jgi:hypothetical protein
MGIQRAIKIAFSMNLPSAVAAPNLCAIAHE